MNNSSSNVTLTSLKKIIKSNNNKLVSLINNKADTTSIHTFTNSDILDKFTVSEDSKLLFDGNEITFKN